MLETLEQNEKSRKPRVDMKVAYDM